MPPTRPRQDNGIISPAAPGLRDGPDDPVARWQRLVDARLIGRVAPLAAKTTAAIYAAEVAIGVRRRGRVW